MSLAHIHAIRLFEDPRVNGTAELAVGVGECCCRCQYVS